MNGPTPIMLVMLSAVALSKPKRRMRWGCSAGGVIGALIAFQIKSAGGTGAIPSRLDSSYSRAGECIEGIACPPAEAECQRDYSSSHN